jgi:protein O-mannosyl-transferase
VTTAIDARNQRQEVPLQSRRWPAAAAILAVLCLTAALYWPVRLGAFVWDDIVCLRDQTWLLRDDVWQQLFARNFCGLTNFFRPAAAILWALQLRAFDVSAAPMHVVSLVIHLLNSVLVGWLGFALCETRAAWRGKLLVGLPMLLYALHPALVEPVAWISAQTELVLTFFMLLGLLANTIMTHAPARALAVSACFFLAACTKETAVAFPLALAVMDWTRMPRSAPLGRVAGIRNLLRWQWRTYAGMVVAGIAYLVLRHQQLGYLVDAQEGSALSAFARTQEVCYLYLMYWRLMIWPMIGLGPVHIVDEMQFAAVSATSLAIDVGVLAFAVYAVIACWQRRLLGRLIVVVSALLLPVLHIIPVPFDESLYHDRYAMAPLALAIALLPDVLFQITNGAARIRRLAIAAMLAVWLLLAVFNVRLNLPLWSTDTTLWQWALSLHPQSISARENLFASYVTHDDPRALEFARAMAADTVPCPTCLLNVAYFAMREHELMLAAAALERLKAIGNLAYDSRLRTAYAMASGQLLELTHDVASAETAYREAIAASPHEPYPQLQLAMLLARAGKIDEANRFEHAALALFAPNERAEHQREFEQALQAQPAKVE